MVDFSVQFNLIAFVVVAAIAGIYFFGNVVLFARMHRHGASFSSVLFFIFGWIFLLASLGVSLIALTARFKLFGISISASGSNLIISGIGNGFEIPFIGRFMQSIFDALMMECFVYGVFVLTLISVILCPVKWKKREDVLEPVKRHGDGDGYVTVESGAFSGHEQPSEEEAVTVAPVIVTEPETEDKTTEAFAESQDDSVEPDNTDISVEPEEVSVETEKEESDGDLILDNEEEDSEAEKIEELVFEPQPEEEAESEVGQKSEEEEEPVTVVAEEEKPIEKEQQFEEQSEEETTEPTEKTETIETEKEEIILKPETDSEETEKPGKSQTEEVQTDEEIKPEADEKAVPQEEEKTQQRVYEYEGMEFNPQRIVKRERKVVRPGEFPEVKQPSTKKTVGGRRRVITSRASEIFDEYMDSKEEDERKRIEAAIDKVTVSNEDK